MNSKRPLIYDLSYDELESHLKAAKQPSYRVQQIWNGIYKELIASPYEITTLPKDLRATLDDQFDFQSFDPVKEIMSRDKLTVKTLFKLPDSQFIEAVLMNYDQRHTLCISSQSGCGMGCSFCATGQMGFKRNLSSGEIIAQVIHYARTLAKQDQRVTNIVMMGMGEPFHNYDPVMAALNRLNHPDAFGLGARRFTISTVGLVPKIKQFADEGTQYNLAISLHTVDDELRSKMIPVNKKYPVDQIIDACGYYIQKTNRRITFEYAVIKGVNDSLQDAKALANKIKDLICHVNLIPLNPTPGYERQPASINQVDSFRSILESYHIPCSIRVRRGIEIQAGCGQLAVDYQASE